MQKQQDYRTLLSRRLGYNYFGMHINGCKLLKPISISVMEQGGPVVKTLACCTGASNWDWVLNMWGTQCFPDLHQQKSLLDVVQIKH